MDVKEAVKKAMKTKKITQMELADMMHAKQSSIAMFLSRGNAMKLDNLLRMVNTCGYDLVLVDRDNVKNTIIIGEKDEVDFTPEEGWLADRVRELVESEIEKRG